MKSSILKKISLFVLMTLIGVLMLNDEKIKIFASNLSFQDFEVGTIAKSGDLLFHEINNCYSSGQGGYGHCALDIYFVVYNPETGEYTDYQNVYNEFDYDKKLDGTNYIEVPQYNGKDVDWISYYKENRGSSSMSVLKFYYVDYKNPKFNVTCDTNILHEGESTECGITLDIMSDVENITCELTSDKLDISELKLEEKWSSSTKDYITTLGYTGEPIEITKENYGAITSFNPARAQNLDVGKFKVTAVETITEASINDIISLSNCEFKDNYKEDKIEDSNVEMTIISNTITTTQKKEEEKVENPKTGVESYVLLGIIITLCGLCILYFVKDNIFKKI